MAKVSKNRVKKQKQVKELVEKFQKAKSVVFVDYKGLNVAQTTELRSKMRKANVDYKVYKNNLVKLALHECGIKELDDKLVNTLAVAFGYEDEVAPAKILKETIDKTKKMELKFGVVDGSAVDENYVKTLATMPSKNELIAKLMFLVKSPVQKLAIALSEIAKKQA